MSTYRTLHLGILAAVMAAIAPSAIAQSTAFTYQGRLQSAGAPANGLHDFRFRLFDAATGGAQVGSTVCVDNVSVSNGLFTLQLDFGQQYATTAPRHLEIDVRADAGANCSNAIGFVTLAPRQQLTATPLASHAKSAFTLDAADGSPANAVLVDNAGNVGIGTATPLAPLHVAASVPVLRLQDTDNAGTGQVGLVSFRDSASAENAWVGFGSSSNANIDLMNNTPAGNTGLGAGGLERVTVTPSGNVGIGTTVPLASIHVKAPVPVLRLQDEDNAIGQVGLVSFRDSGSIETAWMGFGSSSSTDFTIANQRSQANIVLLPGPGGVTRTTILEITGADLAEKFPASEQLEPGMVVAIDRNHSGKLCLARGAYNKCVAGVVSGANNFSAGAVLGNLPGQDDAPPVALSGRVYVRCDATQAVIEPGDLLTTSDTPGRAMKVTDPARADNAIIGKAMSSLPQGAQGLVLVLVNLH